MMFLTRPHLKKDTHTVAFKMASELGLLDRRPADMQQRGVEHLYMHILRSCNWHWGGEDSFKLQVNTLLKYWLGHTEDRLPKFHVYKSLKYS